VRRAAGAALGSVALALPGCSGEPGSAPPAKAGGRPAPPAVVVRVAPVVERPAVERVTFVGTVEASVATTVGAELAGQVVEVPVREGDRVLASQTVLARLDVGRREIDLREAAAALAKAREELDKLRRGARREEIAQREAEVDAQKAIVDRAEADYRRGQKLVEDQLISRAELQRFQSEYLAATHRHRQLVEALGLTRAGPRPEEIAQAQAELARNEAQVDRIRDDLRRGTILAPVSGFAVKKRVEVGAWVHVGTAIADLVVLDPVFVTGPVGEREIARVRLGQSATIALDAYPGRDFEGRITAIIPGADPTSRTFPVRLTVANPGGLLRAGMFARVAIRTGEARVGLFVPRDAVVRRDRQELVFVIEGDRAQAVPVRTGIEADALVEVRAEGLRAGQVVATLGGELLQGGARVQVLR
jgi:cobalt-zinc-cadmium efflux system membrane fusion protein